MHFTIDLAKTDRPTMQVELSTEQLGLPSGVNVVEIEPSRIDLRFEKELRKELLVVADEVGEAHGLIVLDADELAFLVPAEGAVGGDVSVAVAPVIGEQGIRGLHDNEILHAQQRDAAAAERGGGEGAAPK